MQMLQSRLLYGTQGCHTINCERSLTPHSVLRIVGRNRKRLHAYRCLEMKGNLFILFIDFGNLDRSDIET
jgi:hypothetical protein